MTDLIRSACLTSFPELARSLGLQPLRLLDACGIDRRCLDDPDIKLPAGAMGRLLEAAARAAKVEDFGLRLAETRTLSVLGPVWLLVREEPTVRSALHSLIRYIRLHNEALHLRLEEQDDQATISLEFHLPRPAPTRQGIELSIGVLYRVLRSLLGPALQARVRFAHEPPRRRDVYRRVFGGNVAFACDFNGIVCSSRDLDRAIPTADAGLARYARQHLEALLDRPNATMADKVRELVRLQLGSGRCTVDRLARQLGFDRRTLHRRLAVEGSTFLSIVDEVRIEIAARTLSRRGRPLTSVADMLGFSSLSAFSRWFRRRFESSPSQWRTHQHRAAA